jgi:chemotaxis family two-component system response regulator Rcp1
MKAAQIVLIEDNSADVFLVELALKENGIVCELTRFKNGEDAADSLCADGPAAIDAFLPDAILLDLNTPRSDGFQVLGRLRQNPRLSDVPIAIISSSQARNDKHRTGLMAPFVTSKSRRN